MIKFQMLWEDMAPGVTSASAALREPSEAKVDALLAALAAGVTASDADANARGGLCAVHALTCVAAGAWPGLPLPAVAAALLPPVLRECAANGEEDEVRGLAELAASLLRHPGASVEDLAAW